MLVALCGLGRIGWRGFGNPSIETHAATVLSHPRLRLVGVDSDAATRSDFQEATGCLVYESLDAALADCHPSIVTVATPPATHKRLVLTAAASRSVSVILCEKPLAESVPDCREMTGACEKFLKVLICAHQRRWEQRHLLTRAFLKSEVLGRIQGARGHYSGDHLNNGTHAADTLRMLVGDDVPKILCQEPSECFVAHIACEYGDITLRSRGSLTGGYMRAMYDNAIACMDGHETPACSGDDGTEAVRLALAAEDRHEAAA